MKKTTSFLTKGWGIIIANTIILGIILILNWSTIISVPPEGIAFMLFPSIAFCGITNFYMFCIQGYINKYGVEDAVKYHKGDKFSTSYLLMGSMVFTIILIYLTNVKISEPNTPSKFNPEFTKGEENKMQWIVVEYLLGMLIWAWYCHFKRVRPLVKGDKTSFE